MSKEQIKWEMIRYDKDDEINRGYTIMNGKVGMEQCQTAFVPDFTNRDSKAIAELIVKAVNCHEDLIEALKYAIRFIGLAHCGGYKCRLPHCDSCNEEPEEFKEDLVAAAIRKATGGEGSG